MSEHSPGPWRVDSGEVVDAEGFRPCVVSSREHAAADARLIAAAPEMLDMLRKVQQAGDMGFALAPSSPCMREVRELIAYVRGGA